MGSRIAHFTDLHFTEDPRQISFRDLMGKRLLGWANLRFRGRYRAYEETSKVVEAFVRDVSNLEADALVFTGDVTGLALESEFQAARQCLEPLLEDSRVVGIPGNHDVYIRRADRDRIFEARFPHWVKSDMGPDVGESAGRESPRYPLVRLVGDDAAVVAIKDSRAAAFYDSSGRVPSGQLAELRRIVELPEMAGRMLILAMHYCVRLADGRRDSRLHRLRNDVEVLALAKELGFQLILCGHVHQRMVHRAGSVTPVHIANPGSLTYAGRDLAYHWFEIDRGQLRLSARRYDAGSDAFVEWVDAPGIGLLPS